FLRKARLLLTGLARAARPHQAVDGGTLTSARFCTAFPICHQYPTRPGFPLHEEKNSDRPRGRGGRDPVRAARKKRFGRRPGRSRSALCPAARSAPNSRTRVLRLPFEPHALPVVCGGAAGRLVARERKQSGTKQ